MVTWRQTNTKRFVWLISLVSPKKHSVKSMLLKPPQIPIILSTLQTVEEKHAAVGKANINKKKASISSDRECRSLMECTNTLSNKINWKSITGVSLSCGHSEMSASHCI